MTFVAFLPSMFAAFSGVLKDWAFFPSDFPFSKVPLILLHSTVEQPLLLAFGDHINEKMPLVEVALYISCLVLTLMFLLLLFSFLVHVKAS